MLCDISRSVLRDKVRDFIMKNLLSVGHVWLTFKLELNSIKSEQKCSYMSLKVIASIALI